MKRFIVALMVGGALFAVVLGAAATLGVGGGVIQEGSDDTLQCDAGGVQVLGWGYERDDGLVYFVRIGDVSTACSGATMFVAVFDAGGNNIGQGMVDPIPNPPPASIKVDLSPKPAAEDIVKIQIAIEGGE